MSSSAADVQQIRGGRVAGVWCPGGSSLTWVVAVLCLVVSCRTVEHDMSMVDSVFGGAHVYTPGFGSPAQALDSGL